MMSGHITIGGLLTLTKASLTRLYQDYTKAIDLDPDLAQAHYNPSGAYFNKGEVNLVIQVFTKTIASSKPDYAEAHYSRGVAYRLKGRIDEAIEDFNKAIDLKPHYAEAHYNRGVTHGVKGEIDEAIQDYTTGDRTQS